MVGDFERLIIQRGIANILDMPSVYMTGPSEQSLKRATKIIEFLENSKRLFATKCEHQGWVSYERHGSSCPNCSMDYTKK